MENIKVHPYYGRPSNIELYIETLQPVDTVIVLGLASVGHLTHGHSVSITWRYFKSVPYGLRASDARIDMDQVLALAREHKPKLIWCGTTAYPRQLDFKAFGDIAKEVGAVLAAAGASWTDVVKSTVYLTDMRDFPRMNEVYARAMGDARPARSTVQVSGLPRGVLVEIDLIATLPSST
jgi:glycine hydroxymethyltransferase